MRMCLLRTILRTHQQNPFSINEILASMWNSSPLFGISKLYLFFFARYKSVDCDVVDDRYFKSWAFFHSDLAVFKEKNNWTCWISVLVCGLYWGCAALSLLIYSSVNHLNKPARAFLYWDIHSWPMLLQHQHGLSWSCTVQFTYCTVTVVKTSLGRNGPQWWWWSWWIPHHSPP